MILINNHTAIKCLKFNQANKEVFRWWCEDDYEVNQITFGFLIVWDNVCGKIVDAIMYVKSSKEYAKKASFFQTE